MQSQEILGISEYNLILIYIYIYKDQMSDLKS